MKPLIIPVSVSKENTVTLDYTKFREIIDSVYESGVKDGIEKSTLSIPTKPNGPITTEPIWKYPYIGDPICGATPLTNITPQLRQETTSTNPESQITINCSKNIDSAKVVTKGLNPNYSLN